MIQVAPNLKAVHPVVTVIAGLNVFFLLILLLLIAGNYIRVPVLETLPMEQTLIGAGFGEPLVILLEQSGTLIFSGRRIPREGERDTLVQILGDKNRTILVLPQPGANASRLIQVLELLSDLGHRVVLPSLDSADKPIVKD